MHEGKSLDRDEEIGRGEDDEGGQRTTLMSLEASGIALSSQGAIWYARKAPLTSNMRSNGASRIACQLRHATTLCRRSTKLGAPSPRLISFAIDFCGG
jgi:hypothetical protein